MPRGRKSTSRGKKSTAGKMNKKGQSGVYHEIEKGKNLPEEAWTE